jgi:beta-glucosidase
MVAAQIGGVQSTGIISTIKHYALNAQETGRSAVSTEMDEKAMRESDLLAFRIGIEDGKPGAVMCSYNRVNGVYACENPFLLTQVLRNDWHYPGYVMSDWGAVHSTEALLKGLDQQSGEQIDTKRFFGQELSAKLASGAIPQSAVQTAAQRILRTIFAHGLTMPAASATPIDYAAHAEVAQRQAEAGIVLLRNEDGLLPLASTVKSILVVGGHADIGVLSGGGSSQVRPVGGPALEIKSTNPLTTSFSKRVYVPSSPLAALKAALPGADIHYLDGSDPAAAAAAAAKADLAIVFADKWATEGEDNKDLSLEPGQDALIDALAAANRKTVVVLETGNPVLMPWAGKVGAIVEAWYPGQRGGEAIAAVLTGKVDPSGRLPITFPAAVAQLPNPVLPGSDLPPPDKSLRATYGIMATTSPFDAHYPEGSDVGYRWYAAKGLKPLFPFGYGLSYTRFAYSGLKLVPGKPLQARFTVTNTGSCAGIDVPQLYVSGRRAKRLAGWARLSLKPGESRDVTIAADPRVIADYDVGAQQYVVAGGRYRVEVGASSADTQLTANASLARQTLAP